MSLGRLARIVSPPLLSIVKSVTMATSAANVPMAPRKEDEDVWSYPRPPALQRTPKWVNLTNHPTANCLVLVISDVHSRLQVIWTADDGTETIIADTTEGYRVLETS